MFLAKVKAGHDKNHLYLIVKEDEKQVYLVNGTTRKLTNPKKKNPKHIQVIKRLPEEVTEAMESDRLDEDAAIAKLLQTYEQYLKKERV